MVEKTKEKDTTPKVPYVTGFCRFTPHHEGEPHPICPVVIKHERTSQAWTCTCYCHTSEQIDLIVNPVTSAGWEEFVASNGNGHFVTSAEALQPTNDYIAQVYRDADARWSPVLLQIKELLERML